MAKKQTIILKHGTAAPSGAANFQKGELLVKHATAATDTELYTRIDASGTSAQLVSFPSKDYVTNITNTLNANLSALNGKYNDLISSDTGSIREITIKVLSEQLLSGGTEGTMAGESFKTLQELAKWLEEHPDSAAAMNDDIQELEKTLSGFSSGNTVSSVTSDINSRLSALSAKVDGIDANYIKEVKVYKYNSNKETNEQTTLTGKTIDLTDMVIDCGEY